MGIPRSASLEFDEGSATVMDEGNDISIYWEPQSGERAEWTVKELTKKKNLQPPVLFHPKTGEKYLPLPSHVWEVVRTFVSIIARTLPPVSASTNPLPCTLKSAILGFEEGHADVTQNRKGIFIDWDSYTTAKGGHWTVKELTKEKNLQPPVLFHPKTGEKYLVLPSHVWEAVRTVVSLMAHTPQGQGGGFVKTGLEKKRV